jgi:hypothetical protein
MADVHSQADRLACVLGQIEQAGISERFLPSDIVGYGADPIGAVRLARALERVVADTVKPGCGSVGSSAPIRAPWGLLRMRDLKHGGSEIDLGRWLRWSHG